MKLVHRHNKNTDTLKRMGVICYHCNDLLCSVEAAPGFVSLCDPCHDKDKQRRKKLKNRSKVLYSN